MNYRMWRRHTQKRRRIVHGQWSRFSFGSSSAHTVYARCLSLCRLSIHLFSSCMCLFVVCFPLLFLIFVVWSFAICAEPEHTRTTPSSGTVTGHMAAFKSRASVRWLSGCELRKSFCLPNTIIPTPASLRSPERSYSVSLSLSPFPYVNL